VHDFIRIATRRCPPVRIAVYPVAVQGEQAAVDMIRALEEINTRAATEVIVLCRGGGSTEDLWAFNDEHLARAIRQSALPVVSAVGHEIDFTIADFAADLRAPTPSGAAELLTPDREALLGRINQQRLRIRRILRNQIDRSQQRLLLARHRLETMPHPLDRLMLRLDQLAARLERSLKTTLGEQQRQLDSATLGLARLNPSHRLDLHEQRLQELHNRLAQAARLQLQAKMEQFGRATGVLHAVSPLATLARGYAIVRKTGSKKRVLTEAIDVVPGETVEVILHRGELVCRVERREIPERREDEIEDQSRTASTS
jgi:exodeoxyribonuclease VII large subunit